VSKYVTKILTTCVLFVGGVFAFSIASAAYAQSPSISINGERIEIPADVEPPVIINGRTFVPLHPVMEQLGFLIRWREAQQTTILSRPENTVVVQVGLYWMMSRGDNIETDIAPQIINGQVMIPIRAIIEQTDLEIRWNAYSFTVEIAGTLPVRSPVPTIQREIDGFSLDKTSEGIEAELAARGYMPQWNPLSGEDDYMGGTPFFYETEYLWIEFNSAGVVRNIGNRFNPEIRTNNGISIGDNLTQVVEIYGNNFILSAFSRYTIEYFDGETYLAFSFAGDSTVRGWAIGSASIDAFLLWEYNW